MAQLGTCPLTDTAQCAPTYLIKVVNKYSQLELNMFYLVDVSVFLMVKDDRYQQGCRYELNRDYRHENYLSLTDTLGFDMNFFGET